MRHLTVRSPAFVSLAIFIVTVGILVVPALAANCGGGVACNCGDTVVANRTLTPGDGVVFTGEGDTACSGTGLIVNAGVILSLGGNTIRGSGAAEGISPAGDVITVKEGKIVGFGQGVFGITNGSTFSNLQFLDNDTDGVDIGGNGNRVVKCVANRNGEIGISVFGSGNTVQNCRAEFNAIGVWSGGPPGDDDDNVITRNVINRNSGDGAQVSGTDATVSLNQMKFNGDDGLLIAGSGHFVSRNVSQSNRGDGTEVSASASTFDRNRNSYNGGFGINETAGGLGNTYINNICVGNTLGDSHPEGLCR